MESKEMSKWLKLAICLLVCLVVAWFEGIATEDGVRVWYKTLVKPTGTPPNWVFPVVWTVLYTMIAISWWLVWIAPTKNKSFAYWAFGIQLFLNFLWSWLFFYYQRPSIALADIVVLWLAIATTIYAFWRHSKLAACMLIPYLIWVAYAARLNLLIWLNN